jgi:hypothetical protein
MQPRRDLLCNHTSGDEGFPLCNYTAGEEGDLADFLDSFIRGQSTEVLFKMETTSMKMKMMERKQDLDERLASNMMELAERVVKVNAGEDNRWMILHDPRFLARAACSVSMLWLAARKKIGVMGHAPIGVMIWELWEWEDW